MYKQFIKPCIDRMFALLFLLLLAIPMLTIGLLIHLIDHQPALFKQQRIGRLNQPFTLYKFKTMRAQAPIDCPTHLLHQSETYITPFGNLLRKTSLDELPQLINIIKGEMSFIATRPALPTPPDLLLAREANSASTLLPGLSGLAQINGRDQLSVKEKAAYDGQYAHSITFHQDLSILLRTVIVVIRQIGYHEGSQESNH